MPIEVEARFRAADDAPLGRLTRDETLGPAALGPPRTIEETDRYLDTPDGRLEAVRWACRLRGRDGSWRISLKGPPEEGSSGWLHRRPEVEGPASGELDLDAWPPSEAREQLVALAGASPRLEERLRLVQRRTERDVARDGRAVGVLTLDRVGVARAGRSMGELRVVELELRDGGADDLSELAAALERRPGLAAEPRTKLELALELLGEG